MQLLGKWKSIVLAGLVTTALPAEITAENYDSEPYRSQADCYQGCGYFGLSAELLFLQYCRQSTIGSRSTGKGNDGIVDSLKHSLDPGVRLKGNWSRDPCSRLAELELTYLKSSKSVERSGDGIVGFYVPIDGTIKSEDDIDYGLIDAFYYFHEGDFGQCADLSLAIGFRWLKHDATFKELYSDGSESAENKYSSDTNGYGVSFRLGVTRPIFDCWNLKGQFGGSVLCASTKDKWTLKGMVDPVESASIDWKSHEKAVGSIEGALKIARPFNLMCRDFLFFAGVEATHWIGLGSYRGIQELGLDSGDDLHFSDQVTLWGFSLGLAGQF